MPRRHALSDDNDYPGAMIVIAAVLWLLALVVGDFAARSRRPPAGAAVATTATPSASAMTKPRQRPTFTNTKAKDLPLALLGLYMVTGSRSQR